MRDYDHSRAYDMMLARYVFDVDIMSPIYRHNYRNGVWEKAQTSASQQSKLQVFRHETLPKR